MVPALFAAFAVFAMSIAPAARAQDMVVYDDALRNGWEDWSWCARDLAATAPVHAGAAAISADLGAWEALYLNHAGRLRRTDWTSLAFFIHGGTSGGQAATVAFVSGGTPIGSVDLSAYVPGGSVPPGTWTEVVIPLADAGLTADFDGVWIQDSAGAAQPRFFVDDVRLVGSGIPPQPIAVHVEPALDRRAVDPRIFGVNFGVPGSDLPYPVRRWGGNSTTRYSWEDDVSNRANDWFFMNIEAPDPGTLPDGSSSDVFIDSSRAAGAEVILTLPTIGWTPRDRVRCWGFSVATYGPQTETECTRTLNAPWCNPDAGNGVQAGGGDIAFNDPTDTSRPIDPSFVTRWMAHVAGRTGTAGAGGVRFFTLDNEPMLWSSTHRDVHPNRLGYDELWQRTLDYASAVKAQDPAAVVMGPSSWGWCDYFWSDLDGCGNSAGADYAAHGPLLEWYLQSVADHQRATGTRLVDVLDVHYYPQARGVALSDDESPGTQALRFRSVDSLWDPAYVDESWIGAPVRLIPRMKEIIAARLPGVPLAITEYSWGLDDGISSALAQIEVLGTFAREGVDIATRWEAPAPGTKVEDAFRAYLDYDGAGSRIEGESVRATSTDRGRVEAFGFRTPDGRLVAVLVNETDASENVTLTIDSAADGAAPVFGFEEASQLGARGTVTLAGGSGSLLLLPLSVRVVVASAGCAVPEPATLLLLARTVMGFAATWTPGAGATAGVLHEHTGPGGAFASVAASGSAPLSVALPPANRFYLVSSRNACGESGLR